ncbi:MAG: TonB-dependent receptor [Candidatus Margulisbacteria bacterium]|jgi:outer membrane receptor protein involved in Fe transport|nr:TonB-dependent receptor [Candidatus Margulisiibacteriota bacterium]
MQKFFWLCVLLLSLGFSQVYESSGITVVGKRLYDGSLQTGYYGAAQVITSADIQAVGALTVPDVLQKYGIAKYSNGTGSPLAWTLNWNGFTKGQETVVIVDGIKVNEPDENDVYWQNIPVANIERIEIMPGAGSAQYGSGAFAGVINIVTGKVPQKSVVVEAGSYGFGRQGFTLGDTFADNFYYHLNFDNLAGTGYRNKSAYADQRFSGSAGYFTENQRLNFYYKQADASAHYPVQLTADEINDNRLQTPIASRQDTKTNLTNMEYIHQLNDDWSYVLNLGLQNRAAVLKTISKASNSFTGYVDDTASAVSYLGQITYKNKLTLGYDYRLSDVRSKGLDVDHKLTSDLTATKGEYAPYIQYFDRWGPVYWRYGAREDSVDYVQNNNFNKSEQKKEKEFSKRTHNGELGYNFLPDWQVYYSYGEAFKAPTFYNLFVDTPWVANSNPDLTAELAKTQTAGLRWQNEYTNFGWNVFETIVDDEIIGVYDSLAFVDVPQNAQKTSRLGFNLNAAQKIAANIQVFGNYNFTKARFLEGSFSNWNSNTYTYDTIAVDNEVIPQVPEEVYSLGFTCAFGQYTFDFVQNFVSYQYAADYYLDVVNWHDLLPAYNFADAKIGYRPDDSLNIYLSVHNLFNNVYNTKMLVGFSGGFWQEFYTPADLRTAVLGAQWSF